MEHLPGEAALLRYEEMLAGPAIERGLLGPRERERLWSRHILNCAVVALESRLIPAESSVVDVGSGAGLPGITWAIVRPDITVTLVESLLRRSSFLTEAVDALGLAQRVTVIRGRAEELPGVAMDVATARAVAPLGRLLPWLARLVTPGGRIVAFKGDSVTEEVAAARAVAASLGLGPATITQAGLGVIDPPTTVVCYERLRA